MRSNVQWDILPVRFANVERFECMKMLGVFTDSKLLVTILLYLCNQLLQDGKQDLSDKRVNHSVARRCLHCCKGEIGGVRTPKPLNRLTKFGTGDYVGNITPHAKIQSKSPQCVRPGIWVKYHSRVVFNFL